jgi:hypothetical protein
MIEAVEYLKLAPDQEDTSAQSAFVVSVPKGSGIAPNQVKAAK